MSDAFEKSKQATFKILDVLIEKKITEQDLFMSLPRLVTMLAFNSIGENRKDFDKWFATFKIAIKQTYDFLCDAIQEARKTGAFKEGSAP